MNTAEELVGMGSPTERQQERLLLLSKLVAVLVTEINWQDELSNRKEPLWGDWCWTRPKLRALCAASAESKMPAFRVYDLRHTLATRAAESAVDRVTLAAILGRFRMQMAMRYARPGRTHRASAIAKLERHNAAREIQEAGPATAQ